MLTVVSWYVTIHMHMCMYLRCHGVYLNCVIMPAPTPSKDVKMSSKDVNLTVLTQCTLKIPSSKRIFQK